MSRRHIRAAAVPYLIVCMHLDKDGPHSLIGNGLSTLDTPFLEYSHTNFPLIISVQIHGSLHIV